MTTKQIERKLEVATLASDTDTMALCLEALGYCAEDVALIVDVDLEDLPWERSAAHAVVRLRNAERFAAECDEKGWE